MKLVGWFSYQDAFRCLVQNDCTFMFNQTTDLRKSQVGPGSEHDVRPPCLT